MEKDSYDLFNVGGQEIDPNTFGQQSTGVYFLRGAKPEVTTSKVILVRDPQVSSTLRYDSTRAFDVIGRELDPSTLKQQAPGMYFLSKETSTKPTGRNTQTQHRQVTKVVVQRR